LLLDVAALLNSEAIDYAVIGAMAASVHGLIRASIDADAVLFLALLPLLRRLAAGFGRAAANALEDLVSAPK
jgi:hypothetical protein